MTTENKIKHIMWDLDDHIIDYRWEPSRENYEKALRMIEQLKIEIHKHQIELASKPKKQDGKKLFFGLEFPSITTS
tara:strand:+ start:137 stop:364 length:228 start_codon:yes stop_codon:yes gene_type:complete